MSSQTIGETLAYDVIYVSLCYYVRHPLAQGRVLTSQAFGPRIVETSSKLGTTI